MPRKTYLYRYENKEGLGKILMHTVSHSFSSLPVVMEDEEEAAKRARLSTENGSAMGDIEPRTTLAVPGNSCEHCIEKLRLESEMVKSRVMLEGLFNLITMIEQDYYHPVDDSQEYKNCCAEYKAIETELEKLRGKRNLYHLPSIIYINSIKRINLDICEN
ncbi:hypothetical protein AVEN_3053-1 [Araneus ventricosus]|uniref:Uncharacterized protein n=1 Tax=Araneus ventricosus TaxID=182803 RepID=A0A4Y2EKF3_ARAVE|nr:hypothetical protein AVEN_3053-1 [Araneus ventricosus]